MNGDGKGENLGAFARLKHVERVGDEVKAMQSTAEDKASPAPVAHQRSPAKRLSAISAFIVAIIAALVAASARLESGSAPDLDELRRAKLEAGERVVEAYRDAGEIVGVE